MAKRHNAQETSETRRNMVPVQPDTNLLLNQACDRWKVSKTELVKRLTTFFSSAPPSVQQFIVGTVPDDLRDEYRGKVVEFLAGLMEPGRGATFPRSGTTKK